MQIVLRDYQHDLVNKARASTKRTKRLCIQAPTGSGKTVMMAFMVANAAARGLSCWITCHRKELLSQLSRTLRSYDIKHGVIGGGAVYRPELVQIASIQTLTRRIRRLRPPDLMIVDEAHHSVAKTWASMLRLCPDTRIIGLTATPSRTDGSGLDSIFEDLIVGPSVASLTQMGYLSPYRIIAPKTNIDISGVHKRAGDYAKNELEAVVEEKSIVGDAVAHYKKYVGDKTCLVYCVSRHHARIIEAAYREEGVDARYCAGDTPAKERDAIVDGFRLGKPPVIVSVDLFGEGLDVPGLSAVQLLRHTMSLGLYLQQVGRALRVEPGKKEAIILDHVNNWKRHGLPDDDREWTLQGRADKEETEETGPRLLHCPKCLSIYPASAGECPNCGSVHKPGYGKELPEHIDGELEEVDLVAARNARKMEEARAWLVEDLIRLAKERGYPKGKAWVAHKLVARARGKKDFGSAIREVNALWGKVNINVEEEVGV